MERPHYHGHRRTPSRALPEERLCRVRGARGRRAAAHSGHSPGGREATRQGVAPALRQPARGPGRTAVRIVFGRRCRRGRRDRPARRPRIGGALSARSVGGNGGAGRPEAARRTFWRMRIGALRHEVFAVAYLDSGYRLLRNGVEDAPGRHRMDRAAVYPRRVVEAALRRQAAATGARAQPSRTATSSRASTTRCSRGPSCWPPKPSIFEWSTI